jgi:hypothetical protein
VTVIRDYSLLGRINPVSPGPAATSSPGRCHSRHSRPGDGVLVAHSVQLDPTPTELVVQAPDVTGLTS